MQSAAYVEESAKGGRPAPKRATGPTSRIYSVTALLPTQKEVALLFIEKALGIGGYAASGAQDLRMGLI
jgi:hypothetical protein